MRLTKKTFAAVASATMVLFAVAAQADEVGPAAAASPNSVVNEAARWIGSGNMTGRRGPWCAAFANFVLKKTGHAPLDGETVGDVLHYGLRLREPQIGSMAVVSTSYGREGHVGFVAGVNSDGSIRLISGNWSHRVSDTRIARSSVVAFVAVP